MTTQRCRARLRATISRIAIGLPLLVLCAPTLAQVAPTTTHAYDANGNLTIVTNPLGRNRTWQYDPLNRPTKEIEPAASGTGSGGNIQTQYNGQSVSTKVIDPRNLSTTYTVNGLGDRTKSVSPDTGTTDYTFDSAGNVKTRKDARGYITTYSYDALNRLTQILYHDQSRADFTWDTGTYMNGRLYSMVDGAAATYWGYDQLGRQTAKIQASLLNGVQVAFGITRHYDDGPGGGRLARIFYPTGRILEYSYDAAGRVSALSFNGQPLLGNVTYAPFGIVKGWTWASGQNYSRSLDLNGRISAHTVGTATRNVTYDAASRIVKLDEGSAASTTTHTYDNLDRLTGALAPGSTQGYGYDLSGNRTSTTVGGTAYAYTVSATSNRLNAVTGPQARTYSYDAAGNIVGDGSKTYTYNTGGRLAGVSWGGNTVSYGINGLGQRVTKSGSGVITGGTHYVHDDGGHLLGEYDVGGAFLKEYLWLGDTPVGVVSPGAVAGSIEVSQVHSDHLDTPRAVVSAGGVVRWRWDGEPFGATAANADADGDGTPYGFNLRFAGQYFDQETNLHYNTFRDYDPATGRYVQADPIGLAGGSMSLYTYVDNAPTMKVDPLGLMGQGSGANGGTPTWGKGGPQKACDSEDDRCKNTITLTTRGVCDGQGATCAAAMRAAGIAGPYYSETKTFSVSCFATLGVLGKTVGVKAGNYAASKAPGLAASAGMSESGVAWVARGAAVYSNPWTTAAALGFAIPAVMEECECKK